MRASVEHPYREKELVEVSRKVIIYCIRDVRKCALRCFRPCGVHGYECCRMKCLYKAD